MDRDGIMAKYPHDATVASVRDNGEIEVQLQRLTTIIDRVENLSTLLRVRLDVILKPDYPGEPTADQDSPEMAPLAIRLESLGDQLGSVLDRLTNIEQRIAL